MKSKALKSRLPPDRIVGSPAVRAAVANVTRVIPSERIGRLHEGEKPWRENPKSGTGMKKGRKVLEEENRQEGAKPWSRKVSGEANPSKPGLWC